MQIMDVSFSNVLEGARQYFQGLPSSTSASSAVCTSSSMADSPYYITSSLSSLPSAAAAVAAVSSEAVSPQKTAQMQHQQQQQRQHNYRNITSRNASFYNTRLQQPQQQQQQQQPVQQQIQNLDRHRSVMAQSQPSTTNSEDIRRSTAPPSAPYSSIAVQTPPRVPVPYHHQLPQQPPPVHYYEFSRHRMVPKRPQETSPPVPTPQMTYQYNNNNKSSSNIRQHFLPSSTTASAVITIPNTSTNTNQQYYNHQLSSVTTSSHPATTNSYYHSIYSQAKYSYQSPCYYPTIPTPTVATNVGQNQYSTAGSVEYKQSQSIPPIQQQEQQQQQSNYYHRPTVVTVNNNNKVSSIGNEHQTYRTTTTTSTTTTVTSHLPVSITALPTYQHSNAQQSTENRQQRNFQYQSYYNKAVNQNLSYYQYNQKSKSINQPVMDVNKISQSMTAAAAVVVTLPTVTAAASVIKQGKQPENPSSIGSPLDLSVKTVRTFADSTNDKQTTTTITVTQFMENLPISKSINSSHIYPTLDVNSTTIQRNLNDMMQQQQQLQVASAIAAVQAPKIEFQPNFNLPIQQQNHREAAAPATTSKPPQIAENVEGDRKSIFQENPNRIDYKHLSYHQHHHYHNHHQHTDTARNKYFKDRGYVPIVTTQPSLQKSNNRIRNSVISESNSTVTLPTTTSTTTIFRNDSFLKRTACQTPTTPVIPPKIPKMKNWRRTIDLEIEERFSKYKQEQQQQMLSAQQQQKLLQPSQHYATVRNQQASNTKYTTINASQQFQASAGNQMFNNHFETKSFPSNHTTHQHNAYLNSINSGSVVSKVTALPTVATTSFTKTSSIGDGVGGVDKKHVLSLLRNSIEVKEQQKKLEQQQQQQQQQQQLEPDKCQTNIPLYPPLVLGNSGTSACSNLNVNRKNSTEKTELEPDISDILKNSCDGEGGAIGISDIGGNRNGRNIQIDILETILSIRVRTKGELKQLTHSSENTNSGGGSDAIIQLIIEDQINSHQKGNTTQQLLSNSSTSMSTPSQTKFINKSPRKRLFSRNEEDETNRDDKSRLRSSSETSVFDFPDNSDDENEMPVLEAMRRDNRRNSLKIYNSTPSIDIDVKREERTAVPLPPPPPPPPPPLPLPPLTSPSPTPILLQLPTSQQSPPPPPIDDIFSSICDKFVKQLQTATCIMKKRVKRQHIYENYMDQLISEENDYEIHVKRELKDEIEMVDDDDEEHYEASLKQEKETHNNRTLQQEQILLQQENKQDDNIRIPGEQEKSIQIAKIYSPTVVGNVIKSDSDMTDDNNDVNRDGRLIFRNKRRIKHKIISSSESSSDENDDDDDRDQHHHHRCRKQSENEVVKENKQEETVGAQIKLEKDEIKEEKDKIKVENVDEEQQQQQQHQQQQEPMEEEKDPLKSLLNDPVLQTPDKKPVFGDGSNFYPGWEEGVYKYKQSLRIPPSLIQIMRPPQRMRLSTSLPDLDPSPQSPASSITTDHDNKDQQNVKKENEMKTCKSDCLIDANSDNESILNSLNHVFSGKKANYDSEGSSSIKSLPNTRKENLSILDRLLEKCGGKKKKRKYKRKNDENNRKIMPKSENELLPTPTPTLAVSNDKSSPEKLTKGFLNSSVIINKNSAVLPFRKDTLNNFKDAFINSGNNNILGVHDKFTTVVLPSRTRKDTRVMQERATIKEVFGEDEPSTVPHPTSSSVPVKTVEATAAVSSATTSSSTLQRLVQLNTVSNITSTTVSQPMTIQIEPFSKALEEILIRDKEILEKNRNEIKKLEAEKLNRNTTMDLLKEIQQKKFKDLELMNKQKKEMDTRSEGTTSLDGDDIATNNNNNTSMLGTRRRKFGKMRRKFSSGFDYIRKKKKIVKKDIETVIDNNGSSVEIKKKKKQSTKATPESIDDVQKEIKTWVLNKGIGETHLHRAARLGYVDIIAFCLEKMDCHPSPKDNVGYTPLHEACSRGHLKIAKLLLQYGANVYESAQGGIRPLHEAVENGYVEVVRLLLSYGADPSLATYSGITPLSLANDEAMKQLLTDHIMDKAVTGGPPWPFYGPASCFDTEEAGYNILDDTPKTDSDQDIDDVEFDMSDILLPNLYTLRGEIPNEKWVLLQDLSNILKIKSRDALLKQILPPSTTAAATYNPPIHYKSVLRELKMTDFLEQAHCCQFLNMGEKINTRASKIALVKYTDKVKELLGIETTIVTTR